jgi:cysteine desulfurase
MGRDSIYLDHNATSPLDAGVWEAMRAVALAGGNTESRHAAGRQARRALERATESVAAILHADPAEVYFTAGGTEGNNLALQGLAAAGTSALTSSPAGSSTRPSPRCSSSLKRGGTG